MSEGINVKQPERVPTHDNIPEVEAFFKYAKEVDINRADNPSFLARQEFWFDLMGRIDNAVGERIITPEQRRYFIATHLAERDEWVERDHLTGLYNQHGLALRFAEEAARLKKADEPLSLCVLDLDHFKEVNDTEGHEAGNTVLKKIAQVLQTDLGQEFVISRWGGDEFVIILSGKEGEEAAKIMDEVRQDVKQTVDLSFSIGVCQLNGDYNLASLFNRADVAAYAAKNNGRDQVIQWREGMPERMEKHK